MTKISTYEYFIDLRWIITFLLGILMGVAFTYFYVYTEYGILIK